MAEYDPTTGDGKCLFCEIVAGRFETPGIFWQDDEFMAWLAIDPNTEGFSIVVPKRHYGSDVLRMPDDVLSRFVLAAKKVAGILEDCLEDVGRVGLIMEGTGIDHAHIKLVPMHGTAHMKEGAWKQMPSGQEQYFERYEGWISSSGGPMADPADLRNLAKRLGKTVRAT
ncbi:MAG: diadenosine tetraphosphate hydrolase [Candidatus Moranbacteria bacterium]|nr:diadenosine tetraphosphate hydrolase [Candidatus Moranbacteria bacterium]